MLNRHSQKVCWELTVWVSEFSEKSIKGKFPYHKITIPNRFCDVNFKLLIFIREKFYYTFKPSTVKKITRFIPVSVGIMNTCILKQRVITGVN